MWDLASTGLFSGDEEARAGHGTYEILVDLFEAAYSGNRAPVPLYVHVDWLVENARDVRRFAGEAAGQGLGSEGGAGVRTVCLECVAGCAGRP